jgi:U6 snRNA-associated Sm-like protein LSm3
MIEEPIDLVRLALSERVQVKCRGDRTLTGTLHAYDAHLNMVLGNVDEECLVPKKSDSVVNSDESAKAADAKNSDVLKRHMDSLFVRGDGVILISTNPK